MCQCVCVCLRVCVVGSFLFTCMCAVVLLGVWVCGIGCMYVGVCVCVCVCLDWMYNRVNCERLRGFGLILIPNTRRVGTNFVTISYESKLRAVPAPSRTSHARPRYGICIRCVIATSLTACSGCWCVLSFVSASARREHQLACVARRLEGSVNGCHPVTGQLDASPHRPPPTVFVVWPATLHT